MIYLDTLKERDIGRWVEYWPGKEVGRLKSWNGSFLFVVYNCGGNWDKYMDYTAASTHPKSLNFIEEPEDLKGASNANKTQQT